MNMDVTPIIFSFIFGISFLQEIYQCQLTLQWVFLLLSTYVVISYKYMKMVKKLVTDQESISDTVICHVKRIRSLSIYNASNIDSTQKIPLIGLDEKENKYKEEETKGEQQQEEEDIDDYVLHQPNHASEGRISPTPSLSTTSTTSSASFGYHTLGGGGKVKQMIYLFESGHLFHFNANEKNPFIVERKFDFDPTATEWQKRTLVMKSKFI